MRKNVAKNAENLNIKDSRNLDSQSIKSARNLENLDSRNLNFKDSQNLKNTLIFSAIFSIIITLANYTVQFSIGDSYLTYGALIYPFSFLFMDILSERYDKQFALKTLRFGIVFAFVPSFLISEPHIAIASVCAFFISQHLDIYIFFILKRLLPRFWWIRNNLSTIIAQFFDAMIFFYIAFFATFGLKATLFMALSDFSVKILLSLLNTPLFYVFAIRVKNKIC